MQGQHGIPRCEEKLRLQGKHKETSAEVDRKDRGGMGDPSKSS